MNDIIAIIPAHTLNRVALALHELPHFPGENARQAV